MAPVLSKEFLDIQAIGLIMKTWDDRFASKVGGMGNFKKWEDFNNVGMILK